MDYSLLSNKHRISVEYIKKLDASVKKFSPMYNSRYLEDVLKSFLKLDLFSKGGKYCDVNFVTPSDCRFINLKEIYGKLGTWSFGSHSNDKDDVLMGYLELVPTTGIIYLADIYYSLSCVIVPSSTLNISSFINKCVVVKHYRVFTETYNSPNTMNSEYLYFKTCDIEIVESQHLGPQRLQNKTSKEICNKTFRCRIMRKSLVCISQWGTPEIWFEIEILALNQAPRNELFCLGPNSIRAGIFLERGKVYIFFSTKSREIYSNYEIKRCRPNLRSWKINDPLFSARAINPSTLSFSKDIVLCVDEAITNLKTKSHGMLISFKGELYCKKLVRSLSSRTTSKNVQGFGTPGRDTHVLEFKTKDGQILTLYLNNWERIQMPLGLIPGMEILVRDVNVQSSRYYKSTAFTSLEVKDYCAKVQFDTVNLYTQGRLKRDDKFTPLGYGDYLPINIIILARITNIRIRSLRTFISCLSCLTNYCHCPNNDAEITLKLTCLVVDSFCKVLLIANDLELLRLIFNISQRNWKCWCKAIKDNGTFVYVRGNYPEQTGNHDRDLFAKRLYQMITYFNKNPVRTDPIDVKCRKMEGKHHSFYDDLPTFYCLEARNSLAN